MASVLTDTRITLGVTTTMSEALDLKSRTSLLNFARGLSLANGTGAEQADRVWDDTRTIAASGTDDLDLSGVLVDAFGATATFVKVKGIFVYAAAGNTNNVVIGGAAATQFVGPFGAAAHTIAVPPGQLFGITASTNGWPVVNAASDLLRIANSGAGTSVIYDIVILGTSA
jgi:hypothetical protein